MKNFFKHDHMNKALNCATITMIPKIKNPSHVKDFRSIACCTLLYKLVAKVLTNRLQKMIDKAVNISQSGFIPGRQIIDNILIASELVKGYSWTDIPPRCMIKVDLQQAYDSVEWCFIWSDLRELGFPNRFIGWIMECMTSISYSILVNDLPLKPFQATKGLRQGDPLFFLLLLWSIFLD